VPAPSSTGRPLRILITKVGLDGHDRGAKVVARCLRDAGMEVIYTGLHRRPEQVVLAAIQEDVDIIGISVLSGAHLTLVRRILEQLRQAGAEDIIVVVGGVIPDEDAPALLNMGVAKVFSQETPVDVLPQELQKLARDRLCIENPGRS
jgi:methylmalonyl-CoA mutase cobalamin-binding domain/chain